MDNNSSLVKDFTKNISVVATPEYLKNILKVYFEQNFAYYDSEMGLKLFDMFLIDEASKGSIEADARRYFLKQVTEDFANNPHHQGNKVSPFIMANRGLETYNSWEILGTKEDEEAHHQFMINVPAKYLWSTVNNFYSRFKAKGCPFAFTVPSSKEQELGSRKSLIIYSSTENLANVLSVIEDTPSMYSSRCGSPLPFVAKLNSWIAYSAIDKTNRYGDDLLPAIGVAIIMGIDLAIGAIRPETPSIEKDIDRKRIVKDILIDKPDFMDDIIASILKRLEPCRINPNNMFITTRILKEIRAEYQIEPYNMPQEENIETSVIEPVVEESVVVENIEPDKVDTPVPFLQPVTPSEEQEKTEENIEVTPSVETPTAEPSSLSIIIPEESVEIPVSEPVVETPVIIPTEEKQTEVPVVDEQIEVPIDEVIVPETPAIEETNSAQMLDESVEVHPFEDTLFIDTDLIQEASNLSNNHEENSATPEITEPISSQTFEVASTEVQERIEEPVNQETKAPLTHEEIDTLVSEVLDNEEAKKNEEPEDDVIKKYAAMSNDLNYFNQAMLVMNGETMKIIDYLEMNKAAELIPLDATVMINNENKTTMLGADFWRYMISIANRYTVDDFFEIYNPQIVEPQKKEENKGFFARLFH